jgi:hypothetical protein
MAAKTSKTTNPSDIYANMKALYSPTGSFMSGIQATLDRLGKKTNAQGMSNLIGSGLAGTSMAGNLATAFAEDVAAPQLAEAETRRIGALTDIMGQEANYWAGVNQRNAAAQNQINMMSRPKSNMPSIFDHAQQPSNSSVVNPQPGPSLIQGSGYGQAPSTSSFPSVNVGEVSDSIMPASLRGAVQSEPNWVTINGKKYTQNANGQFVNSAGTPLGLSR